MNEKLQSCHEVLLYLSQRIDSLENYTLKESPSASRCASLKSMILVMLNQLAVKGLPDLENGWFYQFQISQSDGDLYLSLSREDHKEVLYPILKIENRQKGFPFHSVSVTEWLKE